MACSYCARRRVTSLACDACGFELGLGLVDVGLRSDAAVEAVVGDAEGVLVIR